MNLGIVSEAGRMAGELLGIGAYGARLGAGKLAAEAPKLWRMIPRSSKVMMGAGAAGWALTGDSRWAVMGAAIPAGMGTGRALGLLKKGGVGYVSAAAGVGMAAATGNPYLMPVGYGLSKGLGWVGRGMFGKGWGSAMAVPRAAGAALLGRSGRAVEILASAEHPAWGGLLAGAGAGLLYGGAKAVGHQIEDPTHGYYPAGVGMRGRGGMPNDFLNTTGLTLALHKRGRVTPRTV